MQQTWNIHAQSRTSSMSRKHRADQIPRNWSLRLLQVSLCPDAANTLPHHGCRATPTHAALVPLPTSHVDYSNHPVVDLKQRDGEQDALRQMALAAEGSDQMRGR